MTERLPIGQELTILELLMGGREKYGLQLVSESGGRLGYNTIYIVLTRMVAHSYLTSRLETEGEQKTRGPKRRLYKVTAHGQKCYAARLASDRAAASIMGTGLQPIPIDGQKK